VGPGGVRVAVTAELSRQSQTSTRLQYDPNLQVEVSRRSEEQNSTEPVTSGGVSVSENTPDAVAGADGADAPPMATNQSSITERNFQNSQEEIVSIVQAGTLERLAVSVVVDEVATVGEDGVMTFAPRPDAELDQIRNLVAAAVGFPIDEALTSGERILQVTSMRFNRPDLTLGTPAPEGFDISRLDFMRIAEIVVLFITALLVILLVARPLVQGAIGGGGAGLPALAGAAPAGMTGLPEGVQQALLEGGDGAAMLPEGLESDDHIDVAHIDGQVKKSSVRKVAALVDQHPDESMSILRTWMHGDEA